MVFKAKVFPTRLGNRLKGTSKTPRPQSLQGGRPPYPTETMVRILGLKRLNNLSDEQMEFQLLDRMSYQKFCGLRDVSNIPDRTTIWTFENRIGSLGVGFRIIVFLKELMIRYSLSKASVLKWCQRGDERIMHLCRNVAQKPTPDAIETALRPDLLQVFPAAFLGRVKVLPYYPLASTLFMRLVQAKLQKVESRLQERYGASLTWDETVLAWINQRCNQIESGACMIALSSTTMYWLL